MWMTESRQGGVGGGVRVAACLHPRRPRGCSVSGHSSPLPPLNAASVPAQHLMGTGTSSTGHLATLSRPVRQPRAPFCLGQGCLRRSLQRTWRCTGSGGRAGSPEGILSPPDLLNFTPKSQLTSPDHHGSSPHVMIASRQLRRSNIGHL